MFPNKVFYVFRRFIKSGLVLSLYLLSTSIIIERVRNYTETFTIYFPEGESATQLPPPRSCILLLYAPIILKRNFGTVLLPILFYTRKGINYSITGGGVEKNIDIYCGIGRLNFYSAAVKFIQDY